MHISSVLHFILRIIVNICALVGDVCHVDVANTVQKMFCSHPISKLHTIANVKLR